MAEFNDWCPECHWYDGHPPGCPRNPMHDIGFCNGCGTMHSESQPCN